MLAIIKMMMMMMVTTTMMVLMMMLLIMMMMTILMNDLLGERLSGQEGDACVGQENRPHRRGVRYAKS